MKYMYEKYLGIYDRKFWLNRIDLLLRTLNELAEPKYNRKKIMKSCSNKNELECIETYFDYQSKYIELHKLIFPTKIEGHLDE